MLLKNGCFEIRVSFLRPVWPIFRGKLAVSFRKCFCHERNKSMRNTSNLLTNRHRTWEWLASHLLSQQIMLDWCFRITVSFSIFCRKIPWQFSGKVPKKHNQNGQNLGPVGRSHWFARMRCQEVSNLKI